MKAILRHVFYHFHMSQQMFLSKQCKRIGLAKTKELSSWQRWCSRWSLVVPPAIGLNLSLPTCGRTAMISRLPSTTHSFTCSMVLIFFSVYCTLCYFNNAQGHQFTGPLKGRLTFRWLLRPRSLADGELHLREICTERIHPCPEVHSPWKRIDSSFSIILFPTRFFR